MAKINGVEIKNLKSFLDHEECLCYQGNVYLNGKKLGFWSQDSWGGPDIFSFDDALLDDACNSFYEGTPESHPSRFVFKEKDVFMSKVVDIKEIEKTCRKLFKGGCPAVYYVTDGFHYSWMGRS